MQRDEAVLLDILQAVRNGPPIVSWPETPQDLLKQAIETIQNGNPAKGEEQLREITRAFPDYLDGWGHLAHALFLRGQYREAVECYQHCQTIFPGLLEAYTLEAECHARLGDYEQAASCYRRSRHLVADPAVSVVKEADYLLRAGKHHRASQTLCSLNGSPSFHSDEVQSRLRQTESTLRIFSRGVVRVLPQLAGRIMEPGLLASLLKESSQIPVSLPAIRDSGFRSFANYLNNGFLKHNLHRISPGPCDLCGNRRSRNVFYLPDRKVVRCKRCGLERLERIPSGGHDLHTGFYERGEIVDAIEKEWSSPHVLEHHMGWLKAVFMVAGIRFPNAGGRLFEIGCGGGHLLAHLRDCGMQVGGIDASSSFVELAKTKFGLPVSCSLIESLDIPEESYDYILSYHVIEHLEHPSILFEKARCLLRSGGYLFIETPVPDLSRVSPGLKRHPTHGYGSSEHSHFFTSETLRRYFERFGFQVIASYEYLAGDLPNGGILGRKQ